MGGTGSENTVSKMTHHTFELHQLIFLGRLHGSIRYFPLLELLLFLCCFCLSEFFKLNLTLKCLVASWMSLENPILTFCRQAELHPNFSELHFRAMEFRVLKVNSIRSSSELRLESIGLKMKFGGAEFCNVKGCLQTPSWWKSM